MSAPTPHIGAKKGDFAQTAVMPDGFLRVPDIDETFLKGHKLGSSVRGVNGFTGEYFGERVPVAACGVGMPSMDVSSYKLFNFFEVQRTIRLGTAGDIYPGLWPGDMAAGMEPCTDFNDISLFRLPGTSVPRTAQTTSFAGILKPVFENC